MDVNAPALASEGGAALAARIAPCDEGEMQDATVAEVLRALEGAAPAWIATDADGTLWSGDVGEDWLDAVAEGRRPEDDPHLEGIAQRLRLPWESPARLVADARARADCGTLPELDYFDFVAATLGPSGAHEGRRGAVREALVRAGLADRRLPETHAVIEGARALGHRIAVISASPRVVVEEALALVGLEANAVRALDVDAYDTRTMSTRPYGPGKGLLLDELRAGLPVLVALGDSAFDAAMLARAAHPLAVRPRDGLVRAAGEIPGLRRLVLVTEPASGAR